MYLEFICWLVGCSGRDLGHKWAKVFLNGLLSSFWEFTHETFFSLTKRAQFPFLLFLTFYHGITQRKGPFQIIPDPFLLCFSAFRTARKQVNKSVLYKWIRVRCSVIAAQNGPRQNVLCGRKIVLILIAEEEQQKVRSRDMVLMLSRKNIYKHIHIFLNVNCHLNICEVAIDCLVWFTTLAFCHMGCRWYGCMSLAGVLTHTELMRI